MRRNEKSDRTWGIIGNTQNVTFLQRIIEKQTFLHHAYLFCGPPHVGKRICADVFIKTLLCQKRQDLSPCEACESCDRYNKKIHADIFCIEAEREETGFLSVATARAFRNTFFTTPAHGSFKCGIIDGAEALTEEAAHTLLKILEEPPKHALFVLISPFEQKLPHTIVSRCQRIFFHPVSRDDISTYLEQRGMLRSSAQEYAILSRGMPGIAIMLSLNTDVRAQRIQRANDFFSLCEASTHERFSYAASLMKEKNMRLRARILSELCAIWILCARDLLLEKCGAQHLLVHRHAHQSIRRIAACTQPSLLKKRLQGLLDLQEHIHLHIQHDIALEHYLLSM